MKTREQDIQAVKNLRHGESCHICWSEEGGAEVIRFWTMLFLFIIPQYGGEGYYESAIHESQIEYLVDYAAKLTS